MLPIPVITFPIWREFVPKSSPNLVTALSGLKMNDFAHCESVRNIGISKKSRELLISTRMMLEQNASGEAEGKSVGAHD